ncbi:YdeI family protein [Lysobacter korlensis]|uniref:YdeI family protein n=1 Tax=Lysobacter korlensis TaxID=553636 RepID=A0ABV6RY26_9GAMM
MQAPNGEEILEVTTAAEWEAWLEQHAGRQEGVWVRLAKKAAAVPGGITRQEALDLALAYGWIDSQSRSESETHSLQRYSPRRARSPWSRINVERVEQLTAEGRMRPAGLEQVEAAKADGRWDGAYAAQRDAQMPEALTAALAASPAATRAFAALGKSAQYAILLPVLKATSPELRDSRVRRAIASLEAAAETTPQPGGD